MSFRIEEVSAGKPAGGTAPSPLGGPPLAFSEAIAVRGGCDYLFISGQVSVTDDGTFIGTGEPQLQVATAFDNFERLVTAAGATMDDVVKLNCYLSSRDHEQVYTAEKRHRFTGRPFPASSTIVATLLHPQAVIELEGIVAL